MSIETVQLRRLSLERAYRMAPQEFIPAYDWLLDHAGTRAAKLPSKQNKLEPGLPVKLVAQRGIHKPSGFDHALTIKMSANGIYEDAIMEQGDGTWVLHYHQQEKGALSKIGTDVYNDALRKCLRDGLPVGVFMASNEGTNLYDCMGLAFVEGYDADAGVFTIHGPVTRDQDADYWSVIPDEDIDPRDREVLDSIDGKDERVFKVVEHVQRVNQDKFRKALLKAYDTKCVISGYGVQETLQAAHISSYMGPKSQVTSNGLLLRADLHLLYDSYLLSVDPDGHRVRTAPCLQTTPYAAYETCTIRDPLSKEDAPSDARLYTHYAEFLQRNDLARQV